MAVITLGSLGRRLTRLLLTVAGLLACLVLTLILFRQDLGYSLGLLAQGAAGDRFGFARTLVKATPLLLAGLGIVVAWRAGMYNIGGEGQFVMGGLAGAAFAKLGVSTLPSVGSIPMLLAACMLGGAAWAWLAGWLYVRRGVQPVISTILLNFVALNLLGWAVAGPLQETARGLPQSDLLPASSMLPRFDRQTDLHAGSLIALAAAAVTYVFLYRTKAGFRIRLVGSNPRAARSGRISPTAVQLQAIVISGALCGLAGGVEYLGVAGQVGASFSQNWGFLAIPVALLAGLDPLMLLLSALYFGALFAGSEHLARFTPIGPTLIYVIQAIAVLGLVGVAALASRKPRVQESPA